MMVRQGDFFPGFINPDGPKDLANRWCPLKQNLSSLVSSLSEHIMNNDFFSSPALTDGHNSSPIANMWVGYIVFWQG